MKKHLGLSASLFCFFSFLLFYMLPYGTVIKEGDAQGYYHSAQLFAFSNKVSAVAEIPPVGPGYAVVLGSLFKIFGDHFSFVVLLNILLSLFVFALLTTIAHRIFGAYAALFICCTFPFHVGFLTYTQCALTEVLLSLLYLIFIDRFLLFIEDPRKSFLLMQEAGLILGISVIVKPAAWFYGLFLIGVGIVWSLFKKEMATPTALFSISFLSIAFGYLSYNWIMFHSFAFPGVMERNFLTLYLPKIFAQVHKQPFAQAYETIFVIPYPERWSLLFSLIKSHPFIAIKIWIVNVLKTSGGLFIHHLHMLSYSGIKMGQSFFEMQGTFFNVFKRYLFDSSSNFLFSVLAIGELLTMLIRPFLCFACGFFYYREGAYGSLLFFISFVAYFLFITGADGCARLRMTLEPLVMLISAGGWSFFYSSIIKTSKNIKYGEHA